MKFSHRIKMNQHKKEMKRYNTKENDDESGRNESVKRFFKYGNKNRSPEDIN